MAVIELKVGLELAAVPMVEEQLAGREELNFMVLEDKPSGRAWLTGYFQSHAEAMSAWDRLRTEPELSWLRSKPELRVLPDDDWKNSYRAHFKAWKFGRLNWVPVWERETFVLAPGEEVLWLDPGMAFGTGNHETTRLVVERLVAFATRRGTGARVIDAGCGSGILALSAAKLGFNAVAGFDNDPEAVRVSEENAVLNGLSGRIDFRTGDLVTGWGGQQADLVMANIQADVLMRFAQALCEAVAPGGELVLSGILGQELAQVRERFASVAPNWGFDSRLLSEWADVSAIRSC